MKSFIKLSLIALFSIPSITFAGQCDALLNKESTELQKFKNKTNELNIVMSNNSWIPQEFAVDTILKNKYIFDSYVSDLNMLDKTNDDSVKCNIISISNSINAIELFNQIVDVQINAIKKVSSENPNEIKSDKFKRFIKMESDNVSPILEKSKLLTKKTSE